MTNTYSDDETHEKKLLEEMRCLRSVMERILRVMDEGLFVDYQMEKFKGRPNITPPFTPIITTPDSPGSGFYPIQSQGTTNPCASCSWPKELQDRYHGTYVGDSPCQWCQHGPKVIC
jgi:hypothetical protein